MSAIPALLEVKDLSVDFPVNGGILNKVVARVRAVDGVSFSIRAGETLGLVGESGCGKSTTGNAILGLLKPTAGTIRFQGKAVGSADQPLKAYARDVQVIFQDPVSALNPRMTIGRSIEEPMRAHGIPAVERRERVRTLLELVGLEAGAYQRFPNELSGGQRQRVVIARALSLRPKLIVCDEPVSALDVSIRSQILNLLVDLQEQFGIAYLFISHDMSVVRYICDRVAVMYLGSIVEEGPRDLIFGQPSHPYTQALLSAVPHSDPVEQRNRKRIILEGDLPSPLEKPAGCGFYGRCPIGIESCMRERPELGPSGAKHRVACLLRTGKM